MKKLFLILLFVIVMLSIGATRAIAHVVVDPAEVNIGTYQNFTVRVPSEKDVPTTSIRLIISEGLKHVTPNVKPGWTIQTNKSGEGEGAVVTEIIWSGGSIPAGQRDDFVFNAQVPAQATTLQWKAHQTYQDGSVVSWDQRQSYEGHQENTGDSGPYSETRVIDDLKMTENSNNNMAVWVSYVALLLSVVSLGIVVRK